mmetsp:Transcript_31134/g.66701  ORF Transcript_31134/g.66701 Transcript_31134/m.66701 type:complete len:219 (+) Transcript_31134:63-719(+)
MLRLRRMLLRRTCIRGGVRPKSILAGMRNCFRFDDTIPPNCQKEVNSVCADARAVRRPNRIVVSWYGRSWWRSSRCSCDWMLQVDVSDAAVLVVWILTQEDLIVYQSEIRPPSYCGEGLVPHRRVPGPQVVLTRHRHPTRVREMCRLLHSSICCWLVSKWTCPLSRPYLFRPRHLDCNGHPQLPCNVRATRIRWCLSFSRLEIPPIRPPSLPRQQTNV